MNCHCNHLALKFSVCVKELQDRLLTKYWLPKLHKRPYKARFIANSSSCSTTELSKLLTSCLTAVKNRDENRTSMKKRKSIQKRGNSHNPYSKDVRFGHIGSNLTLFVSAKFSEKKGNPLKRGKFSSLQKSYQNVL